MYECHGDGLRDFEVILRIKRLRRPLRWAHGGSAVCTCTPPPYLNLLTLITGSIYNFFMFILNMSLQISWRNWSVFTNIIYFFRYPVSVSIYSYSIQGYFQPLCQVFMFSFRFSERVAKYSRSSQGFLPLFTLHKYSLHYSHIYLLLICTFKLPVVVAKYSPHTQYGMLLLHVYS